MMININTPCRVALTRAGAKLQQCEKNSTGWAMAAKGLRFVAWRGSPHTFEGGIGHLDSLANGDAILVIRNTCKLMGIEYQAPAWHLVSDWS